MQQGSTFRLRDHFQDDEHAYKLLTTLPSPEFFARLEALDKDYHQAILHCIQNIYSYIAERNYVEDQESFFHHVASAVAFESAQGVLIKGRNHALKAASIVQMISNTLAKFLDYAPKEQEHLDTVSDAEGLLIHHGKIIEATLLKMCDAQTKAYLLKNNHYDCKLMETWDINDLERKRNRSIIHTEKTPEKKTPKKLSPSAKHSLNMLKCSRMLFAPPQNPSHENQEISDSYESDSSSNGMDEDLMIASGAHGSPILFRDPLLTQMEQELEGLDLDSKSAKKSQGKFIKK